MQNNSPSHQYDDNNIIIIGAGASGIAMGCQLQRKLGFNNFEIYEKDEDYGGTWYVNTYPGCGCDIPSHFYSFSFETNPDWTYAYSFQPEILAYMKNVSKKYDLPARTRFGMECVGAEWDKDQEKWTAAFKNVKTGEISKKECKFLVFCSGPLSVPNPCPVPGAENFKGEIFHSQQWNHKAEIENKDVIVMGNGCSATQFIPEILPKVKSLKQFIRSQHWILPRDNTKFTERWKWMMRNVPGLIYFYRYFLAVFLDIFFFMFRTKSGKSMRDALSKKCLKFMKKAPEKYHHLLVPNFEIGAKRRIRDSGYIECLENPKILLTDDPLVQIKEHSVVAKSGEEHHADVIVYATGFQIRQFLGQFTIKGKSGEQLGARWKRQGGARAYKGVMVADFPNMFTVIGPNTASGHFSIIFMAECNVEFILKILKPFLKAKNGGVVEVTEEGEKEDVDWVQGQLKECIWNEGEAGWYADKDTKHNPTIYPHYQMNYWWRTLTPKWTDFRLSGEGGKNALKRDWKGNFLFFLVVNCLIILIGMILKKILF